MKTTSSSRRLGSGGVVDVRGARSVRMMQDPELGGDLLLVGLVLAARLDFGLKVGRTVLDVGRLAFPGRGDQFADREVRWALRGDIRRYKPPSYEADVVGCLGPMVRAPRCRKKPVLRGYLHDWSTGEAVPHVACSKHSSWFWQLARQDHAMKPEVPVLAPANHGGVLARHIPEVDWRRLWRRLDPAWVEHPEKRPWPRPTLELVLGGGEDGGGERPRLTPM